MSVEKYRCPFIVSTTVNFQSHETSDQFAKKKKKKDQKCQFHVKTVQASVVRLA